MNTTIKLDRPISVEITLDVQEVYDTLNGRDKSDFLNDNINDLKDEDLISELQSRGYEIKEE